MCHRDAEQKAEIGAEPAGLVSYELEVYHFGRGNRPHHLESEQVSDTIKQTFPTAEKNRHKVYIHLIDESGREILLGGVSSSGERHILTVGGLSGLVECLWMPSVTKVNVVPPSTRGACVHGA